MKRIIFIAIAVSLLAVGCNNKKTVDETVETDRYTLHIQDINSYCSASGNNIVSFYSTCDTTVISNSVPQFAFYLASMTQGPRLDSTTMWYINHKKDAILPNYVYTIIDRDTTQRKDYTPLLHAMMEHGILRADTTYESMQLLELYDTTRYSIFRSKCADTSELRSVSALVVQLRSEYRVPLMPAPDMDPDMLMEMHYGSGNDRWEEDSAWLDERGLRVVPDPQGRQMRIIEFNRAKGNI